MAALRSLIFAAALACARPANASPLDPWSRYIAEASARFGFPTLWIRRVMLAESGGEVTHGGRPIVSSAGAMGLMQLMPRTWDHMRLALSLGGDPFDPHDNILAGTAYLRLMYDRFEYPGLFAAYNAGPARYAEFLSGAASSGGDPDLCHAGPWGPPRCPSRTDPHGSENAGRVVRRCAFR